MPARSRIARCSALMIGDHQRASHSASRGLIRSAYSSSSGAFDSYHCGRSQPAASKNTAPSSFSRSWNGGSRRSRLDAHCSPGWTMPYVLLKPSEVRARTCSRVFWCSQKRAMSEECRSISDSPCTIHSATDLAMPGPSLTHTAAHDQRPRTSWVSPSSGIPSGVSESRPLIAYFTPTDSSPTISGISSSACSICWSKSACVNGISVGDSAAASIEGISSGSCRIGRCAYDPISRPMPSWRSYISASMSRTIGNSMCRVELANRGTGPMSIIWWTAGVSGIDEPAMSRDRGAPDAAGDDHDLGLDVAAGGAHAADAAALDVDAEQLGVGHRDERPPRPRARA